MSSAPLCAAGILQALERAGIDSPEGRPEIPLRPGRFELSDGPQDTSCRLPIQRLAGILHLHLDLVARPTCQPHQISGLLSESLRQFAAIGLGRRTARNALPRVAQYVATLEILAVVCLQERDVFRKRSGVVTHVQTRRKDGCSASAKRRGAVVPDPAGAKLDQLLVRKGLAGTWVPPPHSPAIFKKPRMHFLTRDGAIENCFVKF